MSPSIELDESAFQHSSPQSLKQGFSSPSAPPLLEPVQIPTVHDYNFSAAVYDDSGAPTDLEDNPTTEEDEIDHDHLRRISGRSSISSFPASVTQRILLDYGGGDSRTPSTPTASFHQSILNTDLSTSPRQGKSYASPFRNPSSVRAMQMRDEVIDDSESIIHHHRRSGSRVSVYSHRSSNSTQTSPSKRGGRSHHSSPSKSGSKLKKEFPLVLLHCTLLPSSIAQEISIREHEIFQDILPEEYKKRWIMLQDRLMDGEISTRGVLIPHPKEDYDLLEERLLESLDLERPRIRHNHFVKNDSDSGFDSASQTDEDSDIGCTHATKCPDCGKKLPPDEDPCRKWEVKIYAANGLMRAGAWGAAWREMEKIDVEVGVWMPPEIRREVEARIASIMSPIHEDDQSSGFENHSPNPQDVREREIYGEAGRAKSQDEIDGLFEEPQLHQDRPTIPPVHQNRQADLHSLLSAYMGSHFLDRRNVVIAVLSIVVLFYAMVGGSPRLETSPSAQSPSASSAPTSEVYTTTVVSTSTYTALSTMTVIENEPVATIASSLTISAEETATMEATTSNLMDAFATQISQKIIDDTHQIPEEQFQSEPTGADITSSSVQGL